MTPGEVNDMLNSNRLIFEENRACWNRIEQLTAALNKIACWHDGPEVTGRFDEPASAQIAREALKALDPSKSTS